MTNNTRTIGINKQLKEEIDTLIKNKQIPFQSHKQFVDYHLRKALDRLKSRSKR